MLSVIDKIARGELSKNQAKVKYGIPRSTLAKRMKNISHKPSGLGRFKRVFDAAHEDELCKHAIEMQRRFYGLTLHDLRSLAFQLAEMNGLDHPFSKNDKMAGKDWALGYVKRRSELSLRSPEATSLARAVGFNRVQVGKFFDLLKQELTKHTANEIFNVDESGISTVQKPGKVLAQVGCKQVGRIVSAEKGTTTTVVCAINPSGVYVPPMLLFKRKNMNKNLMKSAPYGAVGVPSPKGWMDTDIFVKYLKHFISYVKPSESHPCLMILDGHASHKSLEAVTLAKENNITLLTIPPHTSHKLQPLDVSFFGPLKKRYNRELDKWTVSNPGKRVTDYEIAELFARAYEAVASIDKAKTGFGKTGIFPFNPDVFQEEEFQPSQVTEREQSSQDDTTDDLSLEINVELTMSSENTAQEPETVTEVDQAHANDTAHQDAHESVSLADRISLNCKEKSHRPKPKKKCRPKVTVADEAVSPPVSKSLRSASALSCTPRTSTILSADVEQTTGCELVASVPAKMSRRKTKQKKAARAPVAGKKLSAKKSSVYRPPVPENLRPKKPRLPTWHGNLTSTISASTTSKFVCLCVFVCQSRPTSFLGLEVVEGN